VSSCLLVLICFIDEGCGVFYPSGSFTVCCFCTHCCIPRLLVFTPHSAVAQIHPVSDCTAIVDMPLCVRLQAPSLLGLFESGLATCTLWFCFLLMIPVMLTLHHCQSTMKVVNGLLACHPVTGLVRPIQLVTQLVAYWAVKQVKGNSAWYCKVASGTPSMTKPSTLPTEYFTPTTEPCSPMFLHRFGKTYLGKYSDSVPQAASFYKSDTMYDDLAYAAIWLHYATGEAAYLQEALSHMSTHMASESAWNSFDWNANSWGASMMIAKLTKDPTHTQRMQVRHLEV
jgi:hypothetical protein